MTDVRIVTLNECPSTNSELAHLLDAPAGTVVSTRCQTAGRGQRGNTWESAPGENLTFSILLRPTAIEAARQFEVSMLVSLAIVDTIDAVLGSVGSSLRAEIKWPNDIYVADRKVCGILIENTLTGSRIERCIVGIGLNVNQTVFVSDAPNPASLSTFTGRRFNTEDILESLCSNIVRYVDHYVATPHPEELTARYMSRLWRRSGQWPFVTPAGERFEASIVSVAPDGILTLSGNRYFAFKEVAFVL